MTTFKVKVIGNEPFKTPETVGEFKTMKEAQSFSTLRKEETGRDYRVTVDGISYFDTREGDNISNLTSL